MPWICPSCGLNNVNANNKCANYKCKSARSADIIEPDDFDKLSQKIEYHYLFNWMENSMTPQEELFAEFFQKHAMLVKDMDLLELRAYREKLSLIAREAKAGIYASDEKEKELRKANNNGKPTGFARSVNVDEASTEAVNKIKERQGRMSKSEKILASLQKLGIDTKEAERLMNAGTILGRIKRKAEEIDGAAPSAPKIPVINPFEKKEK